MKNYVSFSSLNHVSRILKKRTLTEVGIAPEKDQVLFIFTL